MLKFKKRHENTSLQDMLQDYYNHTVWYCHKNRRVEQWARTETAEIKPHSTMN